MTDATVTRGRRPRGPASASFVVLLAAIAAGIAGCAPAPRPSFTTVFPDKESAARAVLDALHARDARRLEALAVTEDEFRSAVWPRLPASAPAVGMPLDYLWTDLSTKSRAHLAAALHEHGGRRFELEEVRFRGPAVDYGAFSVHPKTHLVVRDARGATVLRLFGSMIETGPETGWKVYSYIVD